MREVLNEKGALRDVLHNIIAPQVTQLLARTLVDAQKRGAISADLDPRLLVVSLVGLTMFPLAAEHIWRRIFPAGDIDRRRCCATRWRCSITASEASMRVETRPSLAGAGRVDGPRRLRRARARRRSSARSSGTASP